VAHVKYHDAKTNVTTQYDPLHCPSK